MTDILKQLVTALLPVVPWLFTGLVIFAVVALIYLFVQFQRNPEKTRVAVMLEIASLRKFRQVFTRKDDVVVTGSGEIVRPNLGQTISQPLDAKTLRSIREPPPEPKP